MNSLACTVVAAILCSATATAPDDQPGRIPETYRGTWLLRLTSADGGKTYKSGDGKAICEVAPKEVKFVRKVDFSAEKLVVKSVAKLDGKGGATCRIDFEGGEVWTLSENGPSITVVIHKRDQEKLVETFRITVRKQ